MADLEITCSEQVKVALAEDPELAAAMREMFAIFHQVHAGVASGQYPNFEDGVEALTGHRPEPLEIPEPDQCTN